MRYEVVYEDKYYLGELVRQIALEDSLGEIAYRGTVVLEYNDSYPQEISLGKNMRISGTPYNIPEIKPFLQGVIWEIESEWRTNKEITFTVYDRSIYLKSEEEYLFQTGLKASDRIKRYLTDLGLPISKIEDTKIKLDKTIYRAQEICAMIKEDLRATVAKGGDMYRLYMTPAGMELRKIGSNDKIYEFVTEGANIFEITQKRTLENLVSKVKVVGEAPDDMKSPVLKVVTGDTKYGVIQKIIQDDEIKNASEAEQKAKIFLSGSEETFTFTTICIPQIRAGDLIKLNTMNLIVCEVRHELTGVGKTTITCASKEYVKRNYYG